MWIALYLPELALEAIRPRYQSESLSTRTVPPLVLLEKQRVSHFDAAAYQAGVRRGMRHSGVQLICEQAHCLERQPEREQACLQQAAMALLQYTPEIVCLAPQTVLLQVQASLRLFGGLRALRQAVLASMQRLGLSCCSACAPNPYAAQLLARAAALRRRAGLHALQTRRLVARLDQQSLQLLSEATRWQSVWQDLACQTLGDLRALPRPGLQRRCGSALLAELDRLYHPQTYRFEWLTAPAEFILQRELHYASDDADLLEAMALGLLEQLAGQLQHQQLACRHLSLKFQHERQRLRLAPSELLLNLRRPGWQVAHWHKLLHEKLPRLKLPAAVICLQLEARELCALEAENHSLLPGQQSAAGEFDQFLDVLLTRIAAEDILISQPQADHRTELANRWLSIASSATNDSRSQRKAARVRPCQHRRPQLVPAAAGQAALQPLPMALPRPAWLLAEPLALSLQQHRPYYRSPLHLVSQAERIEAGWWQDQVATRDYYIAHDNNYVYYWIFRERPRQAEATVATSSRWFLHGIFG